MQKRSAALICALACPLVQGADDAYTLQKDDRGHYLVNPKGQEAIFPDILTIGYGETFVVACIKNEFRGAETKRYLVYVPSSHRTMDTMNSENWQYMVSKNPEFGQVPMNQLSTETCP